MIMRCSSSLNLVMPFGRHLVAGAAGMMGTFALLRLKDQQGIDVVGVTRKRVPRVAGANIRYVSADLMRMDDCLRVLDGIDFLWLFAGQVTTASVLAENPVAYMSANMLLNSNMLEAAWRVGVKKVLWLSSSTAYPDRQEPLKENDFFCGDPPLSHFSVGWMTRYTETLCRMYATILPRPLTIIAFRPTTIYGEYESYDFANAHVLPTFVRKVVERQTPIEIRGDGRQMRDLIYGDDVLDAFLLAMEQIHSGFEVFNLGHGREYSLREMLAIILRVDGFEDARLVYGAGGGAMRKTLDLGNIEAMGFKSKTTLEVGVSKMIAWYRQNLCKL